MDDNEILLLDVSKITDEDWNDELYPCLRQLKIPFNWIEGWSR